MTVIGCVYTIQFFTHKTISPFFRSFITTIPSPSRSILPLTCRSSHATLNFCKTVQLERKHANTKSTVLYANVFYSMVFICSESFVEHNVESHPFMYVCECSFANVRYLLHVWPEQYDSPTQQCTAKLGEKFKRNAQSLYYVYKFIRPQTETQQASALIMKI